MATSNFGAVRELPGSFAVQTISLATSGFSLVAALAWNELIRTVIDQYIRPYLGKDSGLISLVIYASVTTLIAVLVGLQLGRIQQKIIEQRSKK